MVADASQYIIVKSKSRFFHFLLAAWGVALVGLTASWGRAAMVPETLALDAARARLANVGIPMIWPAQLSLSLASELALTRNWDLLAARAEVDAATAQQLVAREFPNPTFGLAVSKIPADSHPAHTSDGNGFFDRSYDSIASFNQLLEVGGKRSARKMSAAAGLAGAHARWADARRQLELAVTRAYVGILQAEESAAILTDSAQALRREAEIAATRLQAGDISGADRTQIEISARRLELDAATATTTAATARYQLALLLALPGAIPLPNLSDHLTNLLEKIPAVGGQPSDMSSPRPDVVAALADVNRTAAELKLARAQRIPDPTLQAQYEHETPDKPHSLGFGFSLPLPLWNRNRGGIAAASAAQAGAEANYKKIEAQALAEVAVAELELRNAQARRAEFSQRLVPQSASVRQTLAFAYEKGGASLLELLAAQRSDNDLRLSAVQAAVDAINAAATLTAARGRSL